MTALLKTTLVETKLFLRDPAGLFFTVVLPIVLLMLNGSSGNDPLAELGGAGRVDVFTAGYIALIIGTAGLTSLPLTVATYRERGILRRYRATPLSPSTVLGAHVGMNTLVTLAGVVLLLTVAFLGFDLNGPANAVTATGAILATTVAFFAISFALVGSVRNARTAQAIGFAIYFPSIFFSGAVVPVEFLPDFARRVGEVLPLTYVVDILRDVWVGTTPDLLALAVVFGGALVAVVVSARTFTWQ